MVVQKHLSKYKLIGMLLVLLDRLRIQVPLAQFHLCGKHMSRNSVSETSTMMEIRIAVFGSDELLSKYSVHNLQKGSEATGLGRVVGNKGGCVCMRVVVAPLTYERIMLMQGGRVVSGGRQKPRVRSCPSRGARGRQAPGGMCHRRAQC